MALAYIRILRRGEGHPDNELPGMEGPGDPGYGIDLGAGIDNTLPQPPPGISATSGAWSSHRADHRRHTSRRAGNHLAVAGASTPYRRWAGCATAACRRWPDAGRRAARQHPARGPGRADRQYTAVAKILDRLRNTRSWVAIRLCRPVPGGRLPDAAARDGTNPERISHARCAVQSDHHVDHEPRRLSRDAGHSGQTTV